MKKTSLIITILLIFAFSTPVSAAREAPVVGTQVSIFNSGIQTFQAGVPFYISHGWCWDVGKSQAIGLWDFKVSIDGKPVEDGIRYIQPANQTTGCGQLDYGVVIRIYNFPEGMPVGTYIFEGFWYIPCQYGPDPSGCTNPNAPVLGLYSNVAITFTAPYP